MESSPRDLSRFPLPEVSQASLWPSPMEISGLQEIDETENLCKVREDDLAAPVVPKSTPMQQKMKKKDGGCNLRKSLAWNQAFLTEEGVLDPVELSTLSGSLVKSNRKVLSRDMSPFTVYSKCSIRPPLHDLEENGLSKVRTNYQTKVSTPRNLFSLSNDERGVHAASGKTPSVKGIPRSIPRSPATHSQKRVANMSATNPTSKLPRFMPAKPHASSLPTTSRNVMSSMKGSKYDQNIAKVNVEQSVVLRPVNTRRDKSILLGHGKNMIPQVENGTAGLQAMPGTLSSIKLHEPKISGSGNLVSSHSINYIHGGPPAPVQARPSALRMPSPSLGFFCQRKDFSSYNSQSERHLRPSESRIPSLKKPTNLRQNGRLRSLTTTGQQTPNGNAAIRYDSEAGIPSSSHSCLPANCLNPPTVIDAYLPREENMEINQDDTLDERVSRNCRSVHCQKDAQEQSTSNHLLVGINGKVNYDRTEDVPFRDSSSQSSDNFSAEGVQLFPKGDVYEVVHDPGPSTGGSKSGGLLRPNGSSQIFSPTELQQYDPKEIQECDPKAVNLANHLHGEVTRDEIYSAMDMSKQSARNSDIASDFGSELTAKDVDWAASAGTERSLYRRKEQMAGTGLGSSLELDHSLTQNSVTSVQTAIIENVSLTSGSSTTLFEEVEPTENVSLTSGPNSTLFEHVESTPCADTELHDRSQQSDSTNEISSTKVNVLRPVTKLLADTSKQDGIPLNAVPFSDEWLAAVEAFGEDILAVKTGRVQNSPPDKALPEPGPWSPVKKKAQDVGPFDCTKYTKNISASDTQ